MLVVFGEMVMSVDANYPMLAAHFGIPLDAVDFVVEGEFGLARSEGFRSRMSSSCCHLRELSDRDREILTRFYLREQTQDFIFEQMDLSETQFRLLKSRAKARFGELGKKKLSQRAVGSIFMRTSAGGSH